MVVSNYLKEQYCLIGLVSQDKKSVITEIADKLAASGKLIDKEKFVNDVVEREELGSTGIGKKVAIPHARTSSVKGFIIGFGKSEAGIDFSALDGDKVNLVFLMGADPSELNLYLRILAELSKLLMNNSFREELILAKNPKEVIATIKKFERV
ncbi:MAG: PTS sugar transporter subunit IIA [Candidatus Omnitrophica bacterium]|nr:PTS sugar transporter subunit IIA [Candidatus Omnitrophota bacterium]